MPNPSPVRSPLILRPYLVRGTAARFAPPPLVMPARGISSAAAPVTSFSHLLSSGDRTTLIAVSGSFTPDGGTFSNLVDGATVANSSDAIDMPGTGSTSCDGQYIDFDFLVPVYVTALSIDFKVSPSMGPWGWWSSNDLANWGRRGGATWNADTLPVSLSGYPFTGHRYGRWWAEGSGQNFTNNWCTEFTFEIAYGNAS